MTEMTISAGQGKVTTYCPSCEMQTTIHWKTKTEGNWQQRYDYQAECTHAGGLIADATGQEYWRQFGGPNHG